MKPVVEQVLPSVKIGEGPHWDIASQALYFVDIQGKTIHKYVPSTKKHTTVEIDGSCSFVIPIEGKKDKFLTSVNTKFAVITWDGESTKPEKVEIITEVDTDPGKEQNALNDAKCDSKGRVWAGTYGGMEANGEFIKENGSLFSLVDGKAVKHLGKVGISNGLAFSENDKKFYYIDSLKGFLEEFDYDNVNGTISNGKNIFTPSKHGIDDILDGMTIDTDGNLWIALFGGGKVIKIDPRKPETLLETVEIPAKQTTSVAFGGPNMDELYVTTGALTYKGVEHPPPINGATYRVTGLGVKGLPGVNAKI